MTDKNILRKHNIRKRELYKAYNLFIKTLGSGQRLDIINALRKKSMTVSELSEALRMEQTILSHNLRRLKRCGFVNVEKKGRYRIYSLNKNTISPLMDIIDKHMSKFCLHIISKGVRN